MKPGMSPSGARLRCRRRAVAQQFDHTHAAWDALLTRVTSVVRSTAARRPGGLPAFAQDRAPLEGVLKSLSKVTKAEFASWTKPQQQAFLINAYNAFTVEKILTRYPESKSIRDFGKVFGNPWKDKFFTLLGSRDTSTASSTRAAREGRLRRAARALRGQLRLDRLPDAARGGLPPTGSTRSSRSSAALPVRPLAQPLQRADEAARDVEDLRLVRQGLRRGPQGLCVGERRRREVRGAARRCSRTTARNCADGKAPIGFLEYDWALNDAKR